MRWKMYDGRGKMWGNENDNENENRLKRELIWVFLQKELKQDRNHDNNTHRTPSSGPLPSKERPIADAGELPAATKAVVYGFFLS